MLRGVSQTSSNAVLTCATDPELQWRPVATNIYAMVPFTWLRCMFFLGSMALYSSDVVRSGLGLKNLKSFNKEQAELNTFSSFGPYAYPLQTIRKVSTMNWTVLQEKYYGSAENDADGSYSEVLQIKLWPYKFDTLSVGPRALAMQLQVHEYPECLLKTFAQCPYEYLSLNTTFGLLDALIDAVQTRFLKNCKKKYTAFAIEHHHVDTVEQALFGILRDERFIRYYTIHAFKHNATQGKTPVELLAICRRWDAHFDPPSFCTTIFWPTQFPLPHDKSKGAATTVRVDDHIALRYARFQVENPELDFEMVILTSLNSQWIQNSAAVYYSRLGEEISTFIRGRKCDANHQKCETVLVDEFRYERSVIETNAEEMYSAVAFMRGIAQVFVWVRMLMLVVGIASSTWYETRDEPVNGVRLVYMTWVNLLKVPSHVVVYGTFFPVFLYAWAHLTDCYLYHIIVQDAISTTLGADALRNIHTDSMYVTLKMRNIWFVGLMCIVIVSVRTHYRHREVWTHRRGIVGFRGTMMSCLSFTTLFFPLRFPSLRVIDILSFVLHQPNWNLDPLWAKSRTEFSVVATGPLLEIRCFLLAFLVLTANMLVLKVLSLLFKFPMPRIMGQSTVVPYSAGTLWSTGALTGYWDTNLVHDRTRMPKNTTVAPAILEKTGRQIILSRLPTHVRALTIEKRSEETWALIRLMNIVMMTNPWVYWRLRYLGVTLFLYRLKSLPSSPTASDILPSSISLTRVSFGVRSSVAHDTAVDPSIGFLLPDRLERLYDANHIESTAKFEFLGIVNSRSLTWHELIMCG